MKKIIIKIILGKLRLVIVTSVVLLMAFSYPLQNNIVVIVNQRNPIGQLTAAQVKDIYLRKMSKRWKELNTNIIPIDKRGDSDSKKIFMSEVLHMSTIEMYKYFSEREYQNQETPPVRLYSDEDIVNFVHENSAAIGYVMSSSVDGTKNVKIIYTKNGN